MAKATSAPMCKICGTAHWSQQPHDRAGLKSAGKAKPAPKTQPPQHRHQGR